MKRNKTKRRVGRKVKNIIDIILIILISIFLVKLNPIILKKDLLSFSKLIDFHLVFIGIAISLITIIYAVTKSLQVKYGGNDNPIITDQEFAVILKSINLNIIRLVISLVFIIIVYFIEDIDFPFITLPNSISKVEISTIIRLSSFLYIVSSLIDVVVSTIKLYYIDFKEIK